MKWTTPLAILIFLEVIGDFLVGMFGSLQNLLIAPIALAVYATANIFWLISLKKGSGLARGSIYFGVGTLIITSTSAVVFFSEPLSLNLALGVLTGIASIWLLSD